MIFHARALASSKSLSMRFLRDINCSVSMVAPDNSISQRAAITSISSFHTACRLPSRRGSRVLYNCHVTSASMPEYFATSSKECTSTCAPTPFSTIISNSRLEQSASPKPKRFRLSMINDAIKVSKKGLLGTTPR